MRKGPQTHGGRAEEDVKIVTLPVQRAAVIVADVMLKYNDGRLLHGYLVPRYGDRVSGSEWEWELTAGVAQGLGKGHSTDNDFLAPGQDTHGARTR